MPRHPLGSPTIGASNSRWRIYKAPNVHTGRQSSSAASSPPSLNSASSSPIAEMDVQTPTIPTGSILKPAPNILENGFDAEDVFETEDDNETVQHPDILITSSHRRSRSMSGCMMKEKVTWRATGRDSEGFPKYALQIEECQGFKINRALHRLNDASFGDSLSNPLFDSLSSGEDYDSDTSDSERQQEPVFTIV